MTFSVLERHELSIGTEDDIILVRRKVRDVAQGCRFNVFGASAVTTAASELARNVWVHAGRGEARVERIEADGRQGVRLEFRDQGPGIADVARALSGGFSTARSMGLGLSGSKRLLDEFSIETELGRGTRITAIKWAPF